MFLLWVCVLLGIFNEALQRVILKAEIFQQSGHEVQLHAS